MSPLEQARRLLAKAAQDEALVDAVIAAEAISDDLIGFHCQQAAEKMLKAVLSRREVTYRKTHDLRELLDRRADGGSPVPPSLADLDVLNPYAGFLRYDDASSGAGLDRARARAMLRDLRTWAEAQLVS